MSFFPDSFNTRHFPFENNTMKSWSHIWLMLNKFTLRPSTYNTFAMSNSPSREIVPFPFIWDLLPSPKVTFPHFLDSKTLKREWSPVLCLEQPLSRYHKHVTCIHYLKCKLHHKAHFMLAWQISRNGFLFHLPFMYKIFDFHPYQMNSLAHSHFKAL